MEEPENVDERTRRWSALDLAALVAVTVFGGGLRLWDLGDPRTLVFDETYYARDACWYVEVAKTLCGVGAGHAEVHPPLGKWLLAGGIRVFGYEPFGWRLAAALAGTATIALVYLMARRILDSTVGATVASGLLAIDLLHFVQSRIAMLDIFVSLFGAAAILFAVYDRDRPRSSAAGDDAGLRAPSMLDRLLDRPWRLAAGVAAGAALSSKWTGALFVMAVLVLTLTWELGARRADGRGRVVTRTGSEEGPSLIAWLIVVPLAVYALTFVGRLHGPSDSCGDARGTWVGQLVKTQVCMYEFHSQLKATHPYESPPWSWPVLKRPVSYYFQTQEDGDYMEILATGSPLTWWTSLVALVVVAGAALRNWTRARLWGRPEGVILGAFAFAYLPWFGLAGDRSAVFLFYLLPAVPFMCLALGYAAARLGTSWEARGAVVVFSLVALGLFLFYRPLLVKSPLPRDQWLQRIWIFDDCDAPAQADERTRTTGGEEQGGVPTQGWCWI